MAREAKKKPNKAELKKIKKQLEKKGFSDKKVSQLMKPYLHSNSAGKEPSAAMKAVMDKLKIGNELDSSGMGSHYDWKGRSK